MTNFAGRCFNYVVRMIIRSSSSEHWKIISLFLAMPAWFLLFLAKGKELFGISLGFSSFMLKTYEATALLKLLTILDDFLFLFFSFQKVFIVHLGK